jgi:hypothetical protein
LPVFNLIQLPFCKVIVIDAWNAPPVRYFAAFRFRETFSHVLGLPVISEFATFSSPIFLAPKALLGKIYNAGLSLAARRDPGMDIDVGWPPLCVGTNDPAADLPPDWEKTLLESIQSNKSDLSLKGKRFESFLKKFEEFTLQYIQFDTVSVFATDAPLIPRQLNRICELGNSPFTIAFSTGNRVTRQQKAQPMQVKVVSEEALNQIVQVFSTAKTPSA